MYNVVMKEISSIHKDHRKRMREKFLNAGLASFADHEILELLLFYAIPYKDTNPLAHKLINKFGSFEDVFAASVDELVEVDGISENSATLIKLIPDLICTLSKRNTKKCTTINGFSTAIEFCKNLYKGETHEQVYVICLDRKNEVKATKMISSGNSTSAVVDNKLLTKFILQKNVDRVIITHNHPIGNAKPSTEDILFTRKLISAFTPLDIEIVDHVIIAQNDAISFAHEGLLSGIVPTVQHRTSLQRISDKKIPNKLYLDD